MTRLILILAFLFAATPAFAQDKAAKAAAKAHLENGERHQRAGKYDEAIAEFEAGYRNVPAAAFLFNIGQAYRLKGDAAKAVEYYQKYLVAEPRGRASLEANSHIETLTKQLEEERRLVEEARRAEEARAEEERRAREEEERRLREEDERRAREEAEARRRAEAGRTRGRGLRVAGYATGTIGVLLVGASVYFGLRAGTLADEIESEAAERFGNDVGWTAELEAKEQDGNAAERNAIITGVAGGVAIATGVTLYFLGARARREPSVAIVPSVGPDGAGVFAVGTF